MFLFGLNPAITPMVHMQQANDLNTLVNHARNAETGFNYAQLGPSVTGTAKPVKSANAVPAPKSAIEELAKQMQQLTVNYANMYSAMRNNNNSQQNDRGKCVIFGNNNNYENNARNRPENNRINPNIRCFNCGRIGHILRNCPNRRNNQRRNNTTSINYMDYEEDYYGSNDEYSEYEDEDDTYEAEMYLNTRTGPYPSNPISKNKRTRKPRKSESQKEEALRAPLQDDNYEEMDTVPIAPVSVTNNSKPF